MVKQSKSSPYQVAPYDVGYGKPPKDTQFKPGQSGNPKGRRRGKRNLRSVFTEALRETVAISENGSTRKVQKMEAIVQVTINKALKGDPKGLAAIIQLSKSMGLLDEEPNVSANTAESAEDQAILDSFLARYGIDLHTSGDAGQENSHTTGSADDDAQAVGIQNKEGRS